MATFASLSLVCFTISIPFVCPGGMTLFGVFDDYVASWAIFLVGVLETSFICWVYGYKNYSKDLRTMMPWLPERLVHIYAITFWGLITPGVLLVSFC